jgi:hypothetical protein
MHSTCSLFKVVLPYEASTRVLIACHSEIVRLPAANVAVMAATPVLCA